MPMYCVHHRQTLIHLVGWLVIAIALMAGASGSVRAQGSIFGTVSNVDLSTPLTGELTFFGFLDDTDEEIRIESSDGAGYDAGNWYDDFQNYLTEASGNPYGYFFHNSTNQQGFHLAGPIPSNSFQQENIQLELVNWPGTPTGLRTISNSDSDVVIGWDMSPGITYHIYRRPAASHGSFFRLDNPGGLLSDPGVATNSFVDSNIDGISEYTYVIIGENGSGDYSPHSAVLTFTPGGCCVNYRGNMNGDVADEIDIADLTYLVNYMFLSAPAPPCAEEGNIDGSPDGLIDISDLTYLVNYMFGSGPLPAACP